MSSAGRDAPPAGPPPSYDQVTGSSNSSGKATTSSRLQVPQPAGRNGIPFDRRRSMEDEERPLPAGWVRQYDAKEGHQFFVDTRVNPPRSIWHHPYDDDHYLSSLSSEERERLQESERLPSHRIATDGDSTDEEHPLPPRPGKGGAPEINYGGSGGKKGFGTKLKDKLTGTTKEERQAERAQRAEQERQYYEAHQKFRQAMDQAMRTGQPVLLGRDKDGKDVYVEPPGGPGMAGYGGAGGYGQQAGRPGGNGAYGINPYANGPYGDPNARFIRPSNPYNRPMGYGYGGYGGGYGRYGGMGMGMPMMGGLMGGMMLGGLLF